MSNLALETALRGRILPDPTNYTPFIVTMDRRSPDVDFKSLKDNKVIGAVFEAGYLFDSIHMKQSIYKNPKLDSQVKAALDANLVYGLYADVRARSVEEAKQEIKELALVVRRHSPQIGLWLRLYLNNIKSINNKILETYYESLYKLGLKDQMGIYVTPSQLSTIDWESYYEKWYLWIIDPVDNVNEIEEFLTPQFFVVG